MGHGVRHAGADRTVRPSFAHAPRKKPGPARVAARRGAARQPSGRARAGWTAAACAARPTRGSRSFLTDQHELAGGLAGRCSRGRSAAAPRAREGSARRAPSSTARRARPGTRRARSPASRGEKPASPSATRCTASTRSAPLMRLGDVAAGPAAHHPMTSAAASDTDSARNRTPAGRRDASDHLAPVAAGQVHVEQHHVRDRLAHDADRLATSSASPTTSRRHRARTVPRRGQPVVVDEHDRSVAVTRSACRRRGQRQPTSVPPPVLRIAACPPSRAIRPTIDSRQPRRSAGTSSGSKPAPLSRTNTFTAPPRTRRTPTPGPPRAWPR